MQFGSANQDHRQSFFDAEHEFDVRNVSYPIHHQLEFFDAIVLSTYNNATPGMVMRAVERSPWAARIRVDHPPRTVIDVHRAAIAAIVRAEFLVTGSKLAEVTIASRADDHFVLTARWR